MSTDLADQLRLRLGVPERSEGVSLAQATGQSQLLREYFAGDFTGAK